MGISNGTFSVTTSSQVLFPERFGQRVDYVITNLTAGATVFVCRGDTTATANTGIPLAQNQNVSESETEVGTCWQGQISVIGSAAATIAFTERIRDA